MSGPTMRVVVVVGGSVVVVVVGAAVVVVVALEVEPEPPDGLDGAWVVPDVFGAVVVVVAAGADVLPFFMKTTVTQSLSPLCWVPIPTWV